MRTLRVWPAPAKLNLFLHVTGRRPDGYHELQTLFQFLDFGDEIGFTVTPDGRIGHEESVPGLPDDDLCVQAARLLQREAGTPLGARIRLAKRIPVGGGLGGGSSDAATTLLALNALWGLHWDLAHLGALGVRLGADVPVFVAGRAAWAEGVGEQLEPLRLSRPWYVVVAPPVQVPTARVFADPCLTRDTQPITIRDFRAGRTRNDLMPVVCRLFPEVADALAWLGRYGPARMTGSGACVYLARKSRMEAEAIAAQCPPPSRAFVARGLNRHPLHARTAQGHWGVAKR